MAAHGIYAEKSAEICGLDEEKKQIENIPLTLQINIGNKIFIVNREKFKLHSDLIRASLSHEPDVPTITFDNEILVSNPEIFHHIQYFVENLEYDVEPAYYETELEMFGNQKNIDFLINLNKIICPIDTYANLYKSCPNLYLLVITANYLGIKSLTNLASANIANFIKQYKLIPENIHNE